jgi:hypothetical protein
MLVGKNKLDADDDGDDAIVSANSVLFEHVWNVSKTYPPQCFSTEVLDSAVDNAAFLFRVI